MSGHSKWSTIKRKKGAVDAKRGRLFTKLTKEITVSARLGGGDPAGNPRLRLAIQGARAAAMPMDNITRAIKKGTGELEGAAAIEEYVYEGYGPGGVAFIMDVATDNQNRTVAEVRSIFDRYDGNLAKTGAVAFLFTRVGMLRFDASKYSEDRVLEAALEAGGEDVKTEEDHVVVYTPHLHVQTIKEAMEQAGLEALAAEVTMIPANTVACDEETAKKILILLERLEDHDDIQNVWANFDIPDAVMERVQGA